MNTFSDWRDNKNELNENQDMSDMLRSRLNSSSDYLKQALGPRFASQIPETKNESSAINQNLKKDLDNLEERLKSELEKAKAETVEKVEETASTEEEVQNQEIVEEVQSNTDDYKLYRDREETFECNISIEGASLSSAQSRIIIDTNVVNLIFYGKLYKDGRCLVPLKKMNIFPEGTRGQIRLEVIVDDTVFSPWESSCIVEGAKKVFVDIKQKKNVSVNFGETNKG